MAAGNLVPKWHLTRDALGTSLVGESLTIKYEIKIFIKLSFLYTSSFLFDFVINLNECEPVGPSIKF